MHGDLHIKIILKKNKNKSKNENDKKKRLSKYYDSEIFFCENFPGLSCWSHSFLHFIARHWERTGWQLALVLIRPTQRKYNKNGHTMIDQLQQAPGAWIKHGVRLHYAPMHRVWECTFSLTRGLLDIALKREARAVNGIIETVWHHQTHASQ